MKIKFYAFVASVLFVSALCFAEEPQSAEQFAKKKYSDLTSLDASINYLALQVNAKNNELKVEHDENEKGKIKTEIAGLTRKLNTMKMFFANTVGDENLFVEEEEDLSKQKGRDALKELQDLLIPFIDSIKMATKKPRKIEKLRYDIERMKDKIAQAEKAVQNIEKIESLSQLDGIRKNIETSKQMIQRYIDENRVLRNIYKNDLAKELKGKTSFIVAVSDTVKKFFSTKGINLLTAIFIGSLAFFVLTWFKKRIQGLNFFTKDQKNLKKTFNALYGVITGGISICASITTLFVLNDWFLFTLAVLILIGIVWSLKKYLPKFLAEIKLALNLGAIKEGQRIVWENCPWIVKKVGMVIQLENEYLDTPTIFLSVREVVNLHSRPLVKNEQLFPSKTGDFVMLSNNIYGRIKIQTPENVVISISPTLQTSYTIQEYFSLKPLNYSNGFQLNMVLAIGYKHQKNIFELGDIVKKELSGLILNNKQFSEAYFKSLTVEFKEPSHLSLDFFVCVDCAGEMAPEYRKVKRFINSMLVKICNDHDLLIRSSKNL